ncbi:hypothetical protein AX17_005521 [Amanita inopinata Kibby_2008]|nr:hypothetical protein AX17_005521 [Amanita inopinata Kibby_2008]
MPNQRRPDGSMFPAYHYAPTSDLLFHAPAKYKLHETHQAPVDALPNEVLTLIFELVFQHYEDATDIFRDRLSRVSKRWREIVLHTPCFWSVLHLSPSQLPSQLIETLEMCLERSKGYPLDIRIRCYWDPKLTCDVFNRIIPHSQRWKRLSIQTPNVDVFSYLQTVRAPILKSLELSYFSCEKSLELPPPFFSMATLPALTTLTLRNVSLKKAMLPLPQLRRLDLRGSVTWPGYLELCEFLGGTTNVEHLVLHLRPADVLQQHGGTFQDVPAVRVSLPSLRACDVITSEGLSPNLSTIMRQLSCPNILSMTIHDNGSEYGSTSEKLVQFTGSPYIPASTRSAAWHHPRNTPSLCVWSSDPYLAWASLSPRPALTVLQLRAPSWPSHDHLSEMFSSLSALETLVLWEFRPSAALKAVGAGSVIAIPTLKSLDIEIQHTRESTDQDITHFMEKFSFPNLECLRLQNMRTTEWENLLNGSRFSSLRSLTLVDMGDFLASNADPVVSFPNLTALHLVNVASNDFVRRLHQTLTRPSGWLGLQTLSFRGDTFLSKPLLHSVVEYRCRISHRISTLILDARYCMNEESRNWLYHHSDVRFISL